LASSREKSFTVGTKEASKSPICWTLSGNDAESALPQRNTRSLRLPEGGFTGKPESKAEKKSGYAFKLMNRTSSSPAGVLIGNGKIIANSLFASMDRE